MTEPKKRTTKPKTSKITPVAQTVLPPAPNLGPAEMLNPWDTDVTEGQPPTPTDTHHVDSGIDGDVTGNVPVVAASTGGVPGPELLESASRAKLPGEKRHEYWERMRKSARLAGLPRGQLPGSAYVWATLQADREFPPPAPVIVEELPADPEPAPTIVDKTEPPPVEAIAPTIVDIQPAEPADLGVAGLGDIPESWPELPANAQLQVEIAWVSANRLKVRSGKGVDLARALSPAPSYSALSWLETSILFPSKFADISVKATSQQDDEKEHIKRERMSIEEIRGILKEMMEAKN